MGCLKSGCKGVIYTLNALIIFMGLAVCGLAGYLIYLQYSDHATPWDAANLNSAASNALVFVPLAAGILIVVMGCIGNCVTKSERRCALVCFSLMQFVLGAVVIASGVLVYFYNQSVAIVAEENSLDLSSSGHFPEMSESVSDMTIGMYTACCVASSAQAAYASSLSLCSAATNGFTGTCVYSQSNVADVAQALKQDTDFCNAITDSGSSSYMCPADQDPGTQSGLEELQGNLADYSHSIVFPVAIAFMVFGSLLVIAFMGSCYIACNSKRRVRSNSQQAKSAATGAPLQPQQQAAYV